VSLLKLSPKIDNKEKVTFANFKMNNIPTSETTIESRKNLEMCSITRKKNSAATNIKVAKSAYYPQFHSLVVILL
jgi:hypothetical protein